MLLGYARISTNDQNLDLQLDALRSHGCERFFSDVVSGAKASRPGLDEMLKNAREDDVIVIWKLDRLAVSDRSLERCQLFLLVGFYFCLSILTLTSEIAWLLPRTFTLK